MEEKKWVEIKYQVQIEKREKVLTDEEFLFEMNSNGEAVIVVPKVGAWMDNVEMHSISFISSILASQFSQRSSAPVKFLMNAAETALRDFQVKSIYLVFLRNERGWKGVAGGWRGEE
ncbi:MAG: hypothetical protein QXF87_08565 [Thermofilaceae archaeon]